MERTFVMLKPDAVQRNLVGELISRLEKKGLKICALKMLSISRELAERHYEEHKEKPFFQELVSFITSGPVVAMVCEGQNAFEIVRKLMGATDPLKAEPGTIRGDYAIYMGNNIIHGSDSYKSAEKEINLFFDKDEVINYSKDVDKWIYG
ncbi:MAG: nucleoside-diphosphate kinase [Firmicutes bacterium]|nr:nucleoside-diphosphate kinase [Bacillota bacterium]